MNLLRCHKQYLLKHAGSSMCYATLALVLSQIPLALPSFVCLATLSALQLCLCFCVFCQQPQAQFLTSAFAHRLAAYHIINTTKFTIVHICINLSMDLHCGLLWRIESSCTATPTHAEQTQTSQRWHRVTLALVLRDASGSCGRRLPFLPNQEQQLTETLWDIGHWPSCLIRFKKFCT